MKILREFGFQPLVIESAFDESTLSRHLAPETYALLAARGKASGARHRLPIVSADTIVVVGGEILGKPCDAEDAARMLRLLSGRKHDVLSGVVLAHGEQRREALDRSGVRFKVLSEPEIDDYVATREYEGKAGGYAIQGLASRLVEEFSGSYWNIVGFPIEVFMQMWRESFPHGTEPSSLSGGPA